MANEEHVRILKQGVRVWNQWREENPDVRPDLVEANLIGAELLDVNFADADLSEADLRKAELNRATLARATLRRANLSMAVLFDANLSEANLDGVVFSEARLAFTTLVDVNLSQLKGLETVKHIGPSRIGIDTIYRSGGKIPEVFLRGAGVPDSFITFMKSLVGRAIEYYSCFISYSEKNRDFAERLYNDLQGNNVRCWFAPEDLKVGQTVRTGLEEAVRLHDKLLLVLSEASLNSRWVQHEVETAMQKELEWGRPVLFPVRLDDMILDKEKVSGGWAAHLRTRHIGDFRQWKEHDAYQQAFGRLLRDLKAESTGVTKT